MKISNEGSELIILLIICCFLFKCVFTDGIYNVAHRFLQDTGISQKIEQFEESR